MRWLSTAKVSQDTDLPVKILKENADYFAELICTQFSDSVCSSQFPASFKCVTSRPFSKENLETIKIFTDLHLVSKIFEKIMKKRLSIYLENILSKFRYGFRKGFSTEHCLFFYS